MNTPLTIFTPAYNRAYILRELYRSLCAQTSSAFEWLIVDDGSTDGTQALVEEFIAEGAIAIRYIRQENGGKHTAINRGVGEARGELFFIVDSDDRLAPDAVETLLREWSSIRDDASFAGLSGVRVDFGGARIGGVFPFERIDCTALEIRMKYRIRGDLAEAFRTDVLKRYPFPVYPDERFCPEALVWNRIALRHKMRYTNHPIYRCEYRPDGLTAQITRLRCRSPKASLLYYGELYRMPIPTLQRIKAAINFWRFAPYCTQRTLREKIAAIGLSATLWLPAGYAYGWLDRRRLQNPKS